MVNNSAPHGHLTVSFGMLKRELELIRDLGDDFWMSGYAGPIDQLVHALGEISQMGVGKTGNLTIQAHDPIRTKLSSTYDGDRKVSTEIRAEITGIWELTVMDQVKKGNEANREAWFSGLASTQATLYDESDVYLGSWKMEMGIGDSPGSFFHTQIKNNDDPPFPDWLSVPRWPFHVSTPAASLEFVLGELFQHEWVHATSGAVDAPASWRALQLKSFELLAGMHVKALNKPVGSPWMSIKGAKPDPATKLLQ